MEVCLLKRYFLKRVRGDALLMRDAQLLKRDNFKQKDNFKPKVWLLTLFNLG